MKRSNYNKEIHVTNTGIRIYPFFRNQTCQSLEIYNSIYDPIAHKRVEKTGFIKDRVYYTYPYSINKLKTMLPDYRVIYDPEIYPYSAEEFYFNSDIRFTELQEATIREIHKYDYKPRIFVNLQTGRGKTFIGIEMIRESHQKGFIICYRSEILRQWMESLESHTNIDMKRVKLLHGYKDIDKFFENPKEVYQYDIYLTTPALLLSFAKRYGWNKVGEFIKLLHIGVKIVDEAHRNIPNTIMIDAVTNVKKSYYLSADFNQASEEEAKKFYNVFRGVPVINPIGMKFQDDTIKLDYVKVVLLDYDSHPSEMDELSCYGRRGFERFNYMRYQYDKGSIFKCIDTVLNTVTPQLGEYRLLILTSLVEHTEMLYKYVLTRVDPSIKVGMYYGELSPEKKKDTKENAQIIIATYSSFSVGMDAKNIQYVLSMDQIDLITDNQSAGRARPIPGRYAFYFICTDYGFGRSVKQRQKRIDYLKSTKAAGFYQIKLF